MSNLIPEYLSKVGYIFPYHLKLYLTSIRHHSKLK